MGTPPGAQFDATLSAELEAALASRGPDYVPRTEHLDAGKPRFTNRLIRETSPYLLQHAHNPVSWFAWGPEAFAEAKRLDRPLLVSVGYSTCHWCHVMERESFEDVEIARYLNEHYVCIKVDREERPDVDAIYMSAVQQLHGSGGWPMNVWLDHQQRPFFGGTYFPARDGDRGTHRGFLSIVKELHRLWTEDRARVEQAAASLTQAVKENLEPQGAAQGAMPSPRVIEATADYFKRAFDPVYGGTRRAPKFPSNVPVRLLLREHARTGDGELLHLATFTLERMAAGGMYDQLGGGFHRYSVDEKWLVPHFEKMLYDNALLAVAYAEAHQVTGRDDFARVCGETLDYLAREMTSPEGGFYSATDADSEGEEGLFFIWDEVEIRDVLGADADAFIAHYGVTKEGNFEGRNILFVPSPSEERWAALKGAREKLYAVRSKRIPPLRDDKILAAWNGLAISAFAVGGRVLQRRELVERGARAAAFVLEKLRPAGRLMRSFKDGRAQHSAFLDDYAFLIAGLLDLWESTFERRWLTEAIALAADVEAHFADPRGGWFMTGDDQEALLAREKPNYDGAEPSGASVHALNLLRLAELTQDARWRKSAEGALAAYAPVLMERPIAMTELLLALDFARAKPKELVLVWPDGQELPRPLLATLAKTFVRAKVMAGAPSGELVELQKLVPLAEGKVAQGGQATAYVCVEGACQLPTSDPAELAKQLQA